MTRAELRALLMASLGSSLVDRESGYFFRSVNSLESLAKQIEKTVGLKPCRDIVTHTTLCYCQDEQEEA